MTPDESSEQKCVENLQQIYRLIRLYVHHSGGIRFPRDIQSISSMTERSEIFFCAADARNQKGQQTYSYEVVNNPLKQAGSGVAKSRIAVVAERQPFHQSKRLVLFYDGTVKPLDDEAFERLKKNAFVE